MTLQQAIALLQDLKANHKGDRALIQKELGNLRGSGFEVKVALNARTTALVADVERLYSALTAVVGMQAVTQQPEALDAPTLAVILQAAPPTSEVVEEVLEGTVEAPVEQTVTSSVGVRQDNDAVELETDAGRGFEAAEEKSPILQMIAEDLIEHGEIESGLKIAETTQTDVAEMVEVTPSVEVRQDNDAVEPETVAETGLEDVETIHTDVEMVVEPEPSAKRKTLTEIMAMPMPESTVEEERELAMLEQLFSPREEATSADNSEVTLPETMLSNSSQLHQQAKSFESIVLVLVILVLVFKAIINVIKAIEESEMAISQAKSFEQMYVAVGQKVRHRESRVQGFAVA